MKTARRPSKYIKRSPSIDKVQYNDMNSLKVPKTVEVSKQQYTDMDVDVPAEMQRQITSKQRTQNSF